MTKTWIRVTLLAAMDHGAMDHNMMDGMAHDHGADTAAATGDKSVGERLVIWLGKLHVIAIHFPIAMLVAAFFLEAAGLKQGRAHWRSAARIMLVVGAAGAAAAATLGWFAGGFYLSDRNLVQMSHRYLGTAIAVAAVLLAWAGIHRFRVEEGRGTGFVIGLGLLAVVVAIQAFLGGTFMHGGLGHMNF